MARPPLDLPSVVDWLRDAWDEQRDPTRPVVTDRIRDQLSPNEEVLLSTRRHVVVALWPIVASAVAAIVVAVLIGQLPAVDHPVAQFLVLLWLGSVAYVGWRVLDWSNYVFVVTNRRVILFSGTLTRRTAMMPVRKVTDLTFTRTPGGRLMDYGDFTFESAGQDQALRLIRFVPNPDHHYHRIVGSDLFDHEG